jgi:glutamyl-tRNA synthetase
VRADDLASSAPRQRHLAELLGLPPVRYAHVPLVLGPGGQRLAKRDGAVTLEDQVAAGRSVDEVRALLVGSLGLDLGPAASSVELVDLVAGFRLDALERRPWQLGADVVAPDASQADGPTER